MNIPELVETERGVVIGYTSFDEAVQGQIFRGKLKVPDVVSRISPVLQQEMANAGFTYEHFGLRTSAKEVLTIYRFNDQRIRVGIGVMSKGKPPVFWMDGHADDTDFANRTQFTGYLDLVDTINASVVATFCQGQRAKMLSFGCWVPATQADFDTYRVCSKGHI